MQVFEPGLRGAGKIMMRLAERVPPHPGQKAETAQRFDSLRQPLRLGVAGWGKHGHFRTAAHCGNAEFASASPCLPEADKLRWSGQQDLGTRSLPFHGLRSSWGDHAQHRCSAAHGNSRASRGAGAGTGRGGGANAALINAYLDFITADHAHEFHVCLLGKKRDVGADLLSNRLPRVIVEVRPVDENDKVGVPVETTAPSIGSPPSRGKLRPSHLSQERPSKS